MSRDDDRDDITPGDWRPSGARPAIIYWPESDDPDGLGFRIFLSRAELEALAREDVLPGLRDCAIGLLVRRVDAMRRTDPTDSLFN